VNREPVQNAFVESFDGRSVANARTSAGSHPCTMPAK